MTKPSCNFLGLPDEWSGFERSRVVVLPLPYEHSTSYGKGTVRAPEEILNASRYLELYDEELDAETYRITEGISTSTPMNFGPECVDPVAVEVIRAEVAGLIGQGKFVVCLGGEHTIAVGAAQAHTQLHDDLTILQLDAHSDLRQEYEGNPYSHAAVMARIHDFNRNIVQVGIRSQSAEEAEFIREKKISTFYDAGIRLGRYGGAKKDWQDAVIGCLTGKVYITLDCDFFDPALMPAVGTPEPGGFGWYETVEFLRRVAEKRQVVGFDVNELSPVPSFIHPQFIVAKLIYKLIGCIFSHQSEWTSDVPNRVSRKQN
jgi:N1-aminopropylagmatine ureohydrolase